MKAITQETVIRLRTRQSRACVNLERTASQRLAGTHNPAYALFTVAAEDPRSSLVAFFPRQIRFFGAEELASGC